MGGLLTAMNRRYGLVFLSLLSLLVYSHCFSQAIPPSDTSKSHARISVDAAKVMNKISSTMYGSCIEDVNHEIYGGLYDQRLFGESFEEPAATFKAIGTGDIHTVSSMWDTVQTGAKGSLLTLDSSHSYTGRQSQVILHAGAPGKIGIANRGLNRWGIALRKGQQFAGRIYLRAQQLKGPVTVALQSADGTKTYAIQKIKAVTTEWEKYSFRLTSNGTDAKSRFVIYIENPGKLWVDQAVLGSTGKDSFKGLPIRADIATKMQQEGLNFVRYGGSMVNAPEYRWKKMIGDPDKRPPYQGTWYPYSSNGFGIEDFLKFCEAAGFESAFAINIEETDPDAADLAEYLKGDITTPWGKTRAANGHPQPYKVQYIEIGNEEVIDSDNVNEYDHYIGRFNAMYQAIHDKYPEIKLINAAWWRSQSTNMERVFKALDGKAAYWDLHTDADSAQSGLTVDKRLTKMQALFLKWNPNTDMKCTIFEENGNLHNLQRALGHATTLNATRRHGDFLLTSCAANGLQALGQNDNGWDQGQIFFTPARVWGMPPFYAQQMAAKNHLPLRVMESVEGDLDVTATRSEDGKTLVLHVVNTEKSPVKASIVLKGFPDRKPGVTVWTLAGTLQSENTVENPERVIPKKSTLTLPVNTDCEYVFPATSYSILRFEK